MSKARTKGASVVLVALLCIIKRGKHVLFFGFLWLHCCRREVVIFTKHDYFCFRAVENPKEVIVLLHGLGDHSGRYSHVVNHFVPLGFRLEIIIIQWLLPCCVNVIFAN